EGDEQACAAVMSELHPSFPTRLFYVKAPYDEMQIKSIMAKCDLFVGARMHACIGALSQMVPAVGMAYSDKFVGVFDSLGLGEGVADLRALSAGEILEVIDRMLDARQALSGTLERTVQNAKATVLEVMPV